MSRGAPCPKKSRRPRQINPNTLHSEWYHADPAGRTASTRLLNTPKKCATSCIIAAKRHHVASLTGPLAHGGRDLAGHRRGCRLDGV